ncbi:hypothetical protein ACFOWZ_47640 [Lentzea rhizosphaerae]|uniref:Lipoprotein n=1 Tax=Lentzea rhizosphaerae TaxID=2041025 RepID=A0ABV8CB55_9PSEU
MKRSIVLVAIAAAFGLTACTSTPASEQNAAPVTQQPSTTAPSTSVVTEVVTTTVTNPPAPQAVAKVDNRLGYGAIKLGMTLEELRAAGLTDLAWEDFSHGCAADDKIAVSKKKGVERITLPAEARTSKGIGVGSTFAEVKRAYPSASEYRAGWSARVGDNAIYAFTGSAELDHFADTDEVFAIKIGAIDTDCAMAYL